MSLPLLILGLVLFAGLVIVHELGHLIVARRNGVDAEEFGLGFMPRLWSRKTKRGLIFSINALPLGGFVKLRGEHDADTQPGSFGAATLGAKTRILLAGVAMNLAVAFVMLTILGWVGMPQLVGNQYTVKSDSRVAANEVFVGLVEANSPAQQAGLKVRDRLEAIGPEHHLRTVASASQLPSITSSYAGQTVTIRYVRNGKTSTVVAHLRTRAEVANSIKNTGVSKGYLGVEPTEYSLTRSTWSAPIVAAGLIRQFTVLTFKGLGTTITALAHGNPGKASAQVSGPVGIFLLLKEGSLLGYQFVLIIIAIISLTLALMNVLPVPALDGGRLFMLLVSRAIKKPLSQAVEESVTAAGFVFLLFLIAIITFSDVRHH